MYLDTYLIDTKIIINEDDSFLTKFQKILLKYKKIIAIILLIILLIIGYLCNIQYLYFNNNSKNNDNKNHHTCILSGGRNSVYLGKIKEGAAEKGAALKSGIVNAPGNIKAFGDRSAESAKELAPWFYGIIYSISLALLTFLIFMPAIGFIIVGLICFVLLKDKVSYIKSL
jgi:hypothetical protein